jgi:glutamate dehydrogenase (NAD(P)+)
MTRSFAEVWDFAKQRDLSMRTGAYILSIAKVAEAIRMRGIFP